MHVPVRFYSDTEPDRKGATDRFQLPSTGASKKIGAFVFGATVAPSKKIDLNRDSCILKTRRLFVKTRKTRKAF